MRIALIAAALVVALAGTADAGRGVIVITSGDDVFHIRDLDAATATEVGYGKLGYHYDYFGVFWLDLWRSGGEFCVYRGNEYVVLTDDQLEELGGASVPWKYHLPPGLLAFVALIAMGILSRVKRRVKTVFVIAGVLAVIAVVFFFKGLDWEFMIPGGLALWLAMTAYFGMKRAAEQDALDVAMTPTSARFAAQREDASPSGQHRAASASGEHRAQPRPSQPNLAAGTPPPIDARPSQPLVVQRPAPQPATVPLRSDDSVDGPKLLR
jgi:hypothetical protein